MYVLRGQWAFYIWLRLLSLTSPPPKKKKNPETHKRLKRMLFNWTEHAIFRGSPLFQATYDIKTEKQTNKSLSSCQLDAGRLAEGNEHKTDCTFCSVLPSYKAFSLLCFFFTFFRMLAVNSFSDFFHLKNNKQTTTTTKQQQQTIL